MKLEDLNQYMQNIAAGKNISAFEKKQITQGLPELIKKINARDVPAKITLPTGEKLGSASRITALRCHCLFLARKAFGANYIKKHEIYEDLAMDILFYVMRDQFNGDGVKGEFCCPPCTLSLLPLYTCKAFKWVDCEELQKNVLKSLKAKKSIFSKKYPESYAQWALEIQ